MFPAALQSSSVIVVVQAYWFLNVWRLSIYATTINPEVMRPNVLCVDGNLIEFFKKDEYKNITRYPCPEHRHTLDQIIVCGRSSKGIDYLDEYGATENKQRAAGTTLRRCVLYSESFNRAR